ncbi:cytochrome b [Colwellia psychrerythraea]|uniref:Di-heme cytochrome, transmembrane n=1 Tax=Colwellia psychrerythraea TaxID=28229 RepID=A0A099KRY6_COLPS|nr:cytochrome b/b6 domain-containing protein [Colwellia psychrerythraea]KGJ93514.1 Di-heme cytochrome, transmembrane [Colwellia psychrerythraea]
MISDKKSYVIDRVLHWSCSLLILFMLLVMGSQIHNTDYRIKGAIEHKQDAIEVHFIMGALVLLLIFSRIVWSKFFLAESRKTTFNSLMHKNIVNLVHFSMYLVLFSLMVSGFLMVTNYEHPLSILNIISFSLGETRLFIFNQANQIHLYLESAIYFLIALHFTGALYSRR